MDLRIDQAEHLTLPQPSILGLEFNLGAQGRWQWGIGGGGGCEQCDCPVLTVSFWQSVYGYVVLAVPFWLSHSGCPILVVPFWLSNSGCPSLVVPYWLFHSALLWSWSRKESKLLAGAGIVKLRLRLPTPGQTKVVYSNHNSYSIR
jgi:hypothetical protein